MLEHLYFIILVGNFNTFISVICASTSMLCVVLGIVFVGTCAHLVGEDDKYCKEWDDFFSRLRKIFIWSLSILITLLILNIFIPTKKEMAAMYGISEVSKIKGIDKLPENIVKKLNELCK